MLAKAQSRKEKTFATWRLNQIKKEKTISRKDAESQRKTLASLRLGEIKKPLRLGVLARAKKKNLSVIATWRDKKIKK